MAAGDKEAVFVVAARIVAAGAAGHAQSIDYNDALLPVEEVARRLNISVRTIDRRLADLRSDFPQPIRFGGPRGQRKWSPLQIDAYLAKHARVRT